MPILSSVELQPVQMLCTFNTGTMYDYLTGDAVRGKYGKWYIRGGLGTYITGMSGKGNTFKSTIMDSLVARSLGIYPGTECVVIDTEGSKDRGRMLRCGGLLAAGVDPARIRIISGVDYDIQGIWKIIQDIGKYKEEHHDELMIETPFIDPITNKPIKCWLPTFIYIDSFTEVESLDEQTMITADDAIDDKKIKTVWMVDGNKKTLFLRHLRRACEQWGLVIVCVAHIGKNIAMDSYMPPSKQLQHMRQADRLKGVGSKFEFLTRNLVNVARCSTLQSTDKEDPLYGDDATPANDQNEVSLTLTRGKSALSGTEFPFVVSQTNGMLNDVTNYHYLRSNDYYALVGNKATHACAWYPDVKLTRNTVIPLTASDAKLTRALELCAQLLYVKQNWSTRDFPAMQMAPEALLDTLQKASIKTDDILSSRGFWTPEKDQRSYMSILDVLDLLNKK